MCGVVVCQQRADIRLKRTALPAGTIRPKVFIPRRIRLESEVFILISLVLTSRYQRAGQRAIEAFDGSRGEHY